MPAANFTTIWEFHVTFEACSQFEGIYGPGGDWAKLFRTSPGYLGTELIRDVERTGRYLTLDRWTSREVLQQFKRDHHAEYATLDKRCESLTESEVFVGDFQNVAAPPKGQDQKSDSSES
jgi:heme-degrading monooxygenase HmoA